MKKRVTFVFIGSAVLLLFFRSWGPSPERVVVRVAFPPLLTSLPLFVADANHQFHLEGIHLEMMPYTSSDDMVRALANGSVDLLPSVSLLPVLEQELAEPGTFRIFSYSLMDEDYPLDGLLVSQDAPIFDIGQLEGRRVGVYPGSTSSKVFRAFLKKHGVDPEMVALVQIQPTQQLSHLQEGHVDALFAYEPVLTAALLEDDVRLLFDSVHEDLGIAFHLHVAAISREFEARHPRLAERYISAFEQGIAILNNYPNEARHLLPGFTRTSSAVASRVNISSVTASRTIEPDTLQRIIDLLYEAGELSYRGNVRSLIAVDVVEPHVAAAPPYRVDG